MSYVPFCLNVGACVEGELVISVFAERRWQTPRLLQPRLVLDAGCRGV